MENRKIFFDSNENLEITEAFRTIRTNISFLNEKKLDKKILITSSTPSEGKSFIAANYAASIAITGRKVLLIDCDIRRPRAHHSFGIKIEKGLEKVLAGECKAKEVIMKEVIPNLDLLPTKDMRFNVTELFLGDNLEKVLKELEGYYDTIVIDTPPLTVASDAAILSKLVDGAIVVVEYDQVAKKELEFVAEILHNAGTNIYGFVVNKVAKSGLSYGNYGYYNNYYSYYSDYYGEGQSKTKKHHKKKKGFARFIDKLKAEYGKQLSGDLKERRKED